MSSSSTLLAQSFFSQWGFDICNRQLKYRSFALAVGLLAKCHLLSQSSLPPHQSGSGSSLILGANPALPGSLAPPNNRFANAVRLVNNALHPTLGLGNTAPPEDSDESRGGGASTTSPDRKKNEKSMVLASPDQNAAGFSRAALGSSLTTPVTSTLTGGDEERMRRSDINIRYVQLWDGQLVDRVLVWGGRAGQQMS